MITIISAKEPKLDGAVDYRFGRCPWLICINNETGEWKPYENPGASQSGGAGVAAAQFAIDKSANIVVSGDFGPHAVQAFKAAGVEMRLFIEGVGTVNQAIEFLTKKSLPQFK